MSDNWLKAQLAARHLKHEDLAEAIGRDRSVATKIVNGAQPLKVADIIPVARLLKVSATEVLAALGIKTEVAASRKIVRAPILTRVQAGDFSDFIANDAEFAENPDLEYWDVEYPFDSVFALRVEGDSMDRVAPDGSLILVDYHYTQLHDGTLYVFRTEEDHTPAATFKRCRIERNLSWIEPDSSNPRHQKIFPAPGQVFRPIGRVVHILMAPPPAAPE